MVLCAQRTVVKPYPIKRASDNVRLRMGMGVIFYEALTEDVYQTWDLFDLIFKGKMRLRVYPIRESFRHPVHSTTFDPDLPYNHPLSTLCPGDGIRHPSPPPEPYPMPPFGPSTSQQGFDLDQFVVPMIPPLSYYPSVYDPSVDLVPPRSPPPVPADTGIIGEPYDPLYDLDGFIAQYFHDPQGDVAAPVDEDPVEDPMDEDEVDVEMADTDTGEEDVSDGDEPSVSSGAADSDEQSEISTDTCESRA
ncbi:hypothetical protein PIB30_017241 [Stylosanthes scabra]|uniref:Uncharacterized protein n=1 Tax=Stylosanthes scabra TaxID=79078 RepID=A0ABU6Z719_9FABA|nr:hypothetical protein [Stylosanthes scabra]